MTSIEENIKTLLIKSTNYKKNAEEINELSKEVYNQFFGPESPGETEAVMH